MGIFNVAELYDKRTHSLELPHVKKYGHVWTATTDDPTIGALAVRVAVAAAIGGGPGSPHVEDPSCFLRSIGANCTTKDGMGWECPLDFSNDRDASDPDAAIPDPVQRRTRLIPSFVPYQEIVEREPVKKKGTPGKAIVNSAGQRFATPLYEERLARRLVFVRNERDLPAVEEFIYKVNSKRWFGYEPGQVKLSMAEPSELQWEGEFAFYQVTYTFDVRPNKANDEGQVVSGWATEILDCGTMQLNDDGKPVPILSDDGLLRPVTEPMNLDLQGKKLADQLQQKFLTFTLFETADFNKLNLRI